MRETTPTREESRALARTYGLIPVYREVLADMLTPVLAYTLLCPPCNSAVAKRKEPRSRSATRSRA